MSLRNSDRLPPRGDDNGVVMVVAMAIIALAGVMIITMTMIAVNENRGTSRDRTRSAAVASAEGQVDYTLAMIQNAAVSSLPCGTTTTKTDSRPEKIMVTTTVTFIDASGAALACPPPASSVAKQALVQATAVSTPRGGGVTVNRKVETLLALQPNLGMDKAIFGNAGVSVSNNFDLYGLNGPDANVYTNGSFSCTNSEHYRGSIVAQGSITVGTKCTIDVNAWSKTGVTSDGTIGNDVLVSNGAAAINGGTVGGKVRAVSITPASFCTANPAKCVTGATAAPVPAAVTFPQVGDTADWVTPGGYTVVTLNTCGDDTSPTNPARWIIDNGYRLTGKTLVSTSCTLSFPNSFQSTMSGARNSEVYLNNDLAVFATGGVSLSNSLLFTSTDTTKHFLYFVQPYGSTCLSGNLGISLGNLVVMDSTISELLYTPCDVHKANQSSTYGQIYAGGQAYVDNKTDAYYVPIPVFGITNKVVSYTADILYKRENR